MQAVCVTPRRSSPLTQPALDSAYLVKRRWQHNLLPGTLGFRDSLQEQLDRLPANVGRGLSHHREGWLDKKHPVHFIEGRQRHLLWNAQPHLARIARRAPMVSRLLPVKMAVGGLAKASSCKVRSWPRSVLGCPERTSSGAYGMPWAPQGSCITHTGALRLCLPAGRQSARRSGEWPMSIRWETNSKAALTLSTTTASMAALATWWLMATTGTPAATRRRQASLTIVVGDKMTPATCSASIRSM